MTDEQSADLKGRRLLIAEDEYMIALDMAEFFEDAGAEVIGPAGSVKDALALVASEGGRLDGALLDVNLDLSCRRGTVRRGGAIRIYNRL